MSRGSIEIFGLQGYFFIAAVLLILKSIIDAADGELARLKKTPSYTGRFLDSVSDIILNFIIIITLYKLTETHIIYAFLAFFGMQLQGTLYNYYYVILRHRTGGADTTSKIFETSPPIAFDEESQGTVNILFRIFQIWTVVLVPAFFILNFDVNQINQPSKNRQIQSNGQQNV